MAENNNNPGVIVFRYGRDMSSPYRSLPIVLDEVSLEEERDDLIWAADALDSGETILEENLVRFLMEGYGACSYCARIAGDLANGDENSKGNELLLEFDDLMQRSRICVCAMQRRIQELLDRFGDDEEALNEALRNDIPEFVSEARSVSENALLLFRDLLDLADAQQQDEVLPAPELLDFFFDPPSGPAS